MSAPTHTFAWQGFSLVVPESWNLTLHRGNPKLGLITLSDLRQAQLEIRWRQLRPRKVPTESKRLLNRLQKQNARITPPFANASLLIHRIHHEDFAMALIEAPTRIYELSWNPASPDLSATLNSFQDLTPLPLWFWELYGISGSVPPNFRLKKSTLLPGRAQLDFQRRRRTISLGAWSLADRILANRSLRDFATQTIPLVKNNPLGQWSPRLDASETFTIRERHSFLSGRQTTSLTLTHLPEQNIIRWTQTSAPVGR